MLNLEKKINRIINLRILTNWMFVVASVAGLAAVGCAVAYHNDQANSVLWIATVVLGVVSGFLFAVSEKISDICFDKETKYGEYY